MLLEIIDENTSFESIIYWVIVVIGAGLGIVGAVVLWMLFTRMKHSRVS
ncbi:hypothetical protein PLCT1_01395 [Planctomycetaceae bacterium]|nr:hypothetical protein PLCT1_01395 [Planctomycetaceae bacterium]